MQGTSIGTLNNDLASATRRVLYVRVIKLGTFFNVYIRAFRYIAMSHEYEFSLSVCMMFGIFYVAS